jgi:hypothetical protein
MRSNTARVAVVLGAIALVVVLFVVLNDDNSNDTSSTPVTTREQAGGSVGSGKANATDDGKTSQTNQQLKPPVTIVVRNGKPVGGVKRLEYKKGDHVRFVVRSDVSDEIHVHGYDRSNLVNAGGTARFDFKANLEGVFEVELENLHRQIAELRVTPS